ncbi:MAG: small basic family protein [Fimbriimonadaceae bacterium]|jgi:small basic protein
MILVPIFALVLGILIPFFLQIGPLQGVTGQYLAIACLAGLDTVCGGIRTGLEGKFNSAVFYSGFIFNICIAFGLAWFGDRIGINLFLIAALVLGQRIFSNLSIIRRQLLTKWRSDRERKIAQKQAQTQTQPQVNP